MLFRSYHGHQELVKGITTEFSGRALAAIELAHWYEMVMIFGFIYLFFAYAKLTAFAVALLVYFIFVFIDNTFARVKWQAMLLSSWLISLLLGLGNIILLLIIKAG